MENFRIRSYGWQEIALLYSPDITPNGAMKRLHKWINKNPELQKDLRQTGWQKRTFTLTPKQVQILINHLGEP